MQRTAAFSALVLSPLSAACPVPFLGLVPQVGIDQMGKQLVNSRSGPPKFEKPSMTLDVLLQYGHMLVAEQENVKRVQLADAYLSGAALGDANKDAIETGSFDGRCVGHCTVMYCNVLLSNVRDMMAVFVYTP